jgi:hypothetical protein
MKIVTGGGRKLPPQSPPKFGGIDPVRLYRRDEVLARLGIGAAGFRQLVASGLKTCTHGKRIFVLGSEIIACVQRTEGGDA